MCRLTADENGNVRARCQTRRDAAEQGARGTPTAAADDEQIEATISGGVFERVGGGAEENRSFGALDRDRSSGGVEVPLGLTTTLRRSPDRAVVVDDGRECQPADALAQQGDGSSCRRQGFVGSVDSDEHADPAVFTWRERDVGDVRPALACDRVDGERDDQGAEHGAQVRPGEECVTTAAHPDRDHDPDRAPNHQCDEEH